MKSIIWIPCVFSLSCIPISAEDQKQSDDKVKSKQGVEKKDDKIEYTSPGVGTPLRKELMDTIRIPAAVHFGQQVVFKVNTLRVTDTWAFFVGEAIQPDGKKVDYKKSKQYAEDKKSTEIGLEAGNLYGGVDALLKKEGDKWKIIAITYDPTDVHWLDYDKRYGVPKRLISDPVN